MGIPLTMRSVTALFCPRVGPLARASAAEPIGSGRPTRRRTGSSSAGHGRRKLEQADFVGVPGFVDQTIVDKANEALSHVNASWDFARTLGRSLPLPATLAPVSRVDLRVAGGEAVVTKDGILLAIDLDATVQRDRPSPDVPPDLA